MATDRFIYFLAFTLLFTLTVSSDPPQISPSPAPQHTSDHSPSNSTPSPPPTTGSPPAPPPSDLPPTPTPSSVISPPPSLPPAPDLVVATSDVSSSNVKADELNESNESSAGGTSSGKKAGIAIGVIGAACVVGFGIMLYKKRQYNIRRAEFSSAARREFL